MYRASSVRAPLGYRNIMQTEINEPKEGDYYSVKKNGEDWPVIICDEEIIQNFFTRSPRPESARQADGTWGSSYKAGGTSIRHRRFPALNLGTLEFMWIPLQELDPVDVDMGRVIRSSTTNSLLAKAWQEYIGQYKGDKILEWRNLDHWKARLHAQRLDRTVPPRAHKEKYSTGKKHGGVKRKSTPEFKYPPGYSNENVDDEEPEDLFLPQGNPAGPKIKRESINSMSSEEMDALYDDADPPYPTSSESRKRSKLNLSGLFSMQTSTPSIGIGRHAKPVTFPIRRETPFQFTNNKTDVSDPDTVLIYVDNPHKKYKVKRSGLDASPLLSKLLANHSENGGWYIMSPLLSSLDANDFRPVGEYIDRREYDPNILDDGTVHVRLEGDLMPEVLKMEIVRCGTIYQIAQMLEMPGLQELAFRKLKALAPHYQALEILVVIESLFEIGSPEIRQYLTHYVADNYWKWVLAETERMVEVMRANEGLAKGVFRILCGPDDKVKNEEVKMETVKKEEGREEGRGDGREEGREDLSTVKREGKDEESSEQWAIRTNEKKDEDEEHAETNDERKPKQTNNRWIFYGADRVEGPDVADSQARSREKVANEGLSLAEEEMIKMALDQSDEKSEDDWVQLVQKQSELFEAF